MARLRMRARLRTRCPKSILPPQDAGAQAAGLFSMRADPFSARARWLVYVWCRLNSTYTWRHTTASALCRRRYGAWLDTWRMFALTACAWRDRVLVGGHCGWDAGANRHRAPPRIAATCPFGPAGHQLAAQTSAAPAMPRSTSSTARHMSTSGLLPGSAGAHAALQQRHRCRVAQTQDCLRSLGPR